VDQFKTIGHSLKIWGPLRKLFASPSVPNWLRACYTTKDAEDETNLHIVLFMYIVFS